jgi:hypothetical protein
MLVAADLYFGSGRVGEVKESTMAGLDAGWADAEVEVDVEVAAVTG